MNALKELRALGWTVAIHNDYAIDGVHHTFYLLTKGNHFVKGEAQTDLEALAICRYQADELDKPIPIDGKFGISKYGPTSSRHIVNLVSGQEIPEDEPLLLLRARDKNALPLIVYYREVCRDQGCNDLHLAGIAQIINEFERFQSDHPERMKEPGVTRHLKLKDVR